MTDEHDNQLEQPNEELEAVDESTPSADVSTDDFDVESALAAVASLHELAAEADDPVEETDDDESLLQSDDEVDELPILASAEEDAAATALDDLFEQSADSNFPHPPLSELHRGTLASIVPAALLMGIGGLLTFIITTSEEPVSSALLFAFALGGLGVMLLAQWLSSGRWSVGNFFIGSSLLLLAITGAYLIQPNNLSVAQGYPLFLTAFGLAFVLTEIFTSARRVWYVGLIIGIAGIVGVLITGELLDATITDTLTTYWFIPVILLGILLFAPLLRRREAVEHE